MILSALINIWNASFANLRHIRISMWHFPFSSRALPRYIKFYPFWMLISPIINWNFVLFFVPLMINQTFCIPVINGYPFFEEVL